MSLPVEVQRAEIIDWWETEHQRISEALVDRLPALYYRVDQEIAKVSVTQFRKKGRFLAETIEPAVIHWIEKIYCEFTHELDEALRKSQRSLEGKAAIDRWSYQELAFAGSALAVSVAPVAAVPLFAGGLTTAGVTVAGITFGGGALLALPVAALAGSIALIAAGPTVRAKAVSKLKSRIRSDLHQSIETRVLGDPNNPESPSLKGVLLKELYDVATKRLDRVT